MFLRFFYVAALVAAVPLSAQTLTPEQLRAMVDERVATQNPFEELLNDPDPARSLAAMEIMLESGDSTLTRMALEFGLLSTNPTVRRTAVEAYLKSKPVLSLRFDTSVTESRNLQGTIQRMSGTLSPEKIAYVRMQVGEYNTDNKCYMLMSGADCFLTVNADGILLQNEGWVSGRVEIGEAGGLEGSALLWNVSESIPLTIQLLD